MNEIRIREGISYAPSILKRLTLDLAVPVSPRGDCLLLMIHGGGWDKGDKDVFCPEMQHFARRGIATATMNYRRSDDAVFPACLEDVLAAIEFLRRDSSRRVVLLGHSAGGHLAAAAGLRHGIMADGRIVASQDRAVVAVISLCGVHDLRYATLRGQGFPFRRHVELLLGGGLEEPEIQDRAEAASPIALLTAWKGRADAPRFLLMHGEADRGVPPAQTLNFAKALEQARIPVEHQAVPGAGHYILHEARESCLRRIERFVLGL
ncbi:MAG: alpha/beta fold hydrolase [Phycisphaeraceae bacterium]|nr:alpha/beta fold hydrolase [Phycisphaeraceae bacterium]